MVWGSRSPALMDDTYASFETNVYKLPGNSNADQCTKRKGWNNIALHCTKTLFKWKPHKSYHGSNTDELKSSEESRLILPSEDSHEH